MKSIATSELTIHPALKSMHRWGNDDPRFHALTEDIRARGIDQPILVDSENRIVDGRHRYFAAKKLKLAEVPVKVIGENEVFGVIFGSILQRRHYTKGQRAYLMAPLISEAMEEGKRRHLAMLKAGGKSALVLANNAEEFAERVGCAAKLVKQARRLHELFTAQPKLRDEFEPEILDEDDPIGLGACIAGIAGKDATADKPRNDRDNGQAELIGEAWDAIKNRAKNWGKLSDTQRAQLLPRLRVAIAAMPQDLRGIVKSTLNQIDKEEKASG